MCLVKGLETGESGDKVTESEGSMARVWMMGMEHTHLPGVPSESPSDLGLKLFS